MGDVIRGTHSSYQTFDTCPRMYQAKYVTKEVKFVQGPEAIWGDEVHLAAELYVKQSKPMPSNMRHYAPIVHAVASRPGEVTAERKFAVNVLRQSVEYYSSDVWLRGKIDLTILRGATAEVFDWKTGKVKPDPAQLKLYGLATLASNPGVEQVKAGYVWLKDRFITPPVVVSRQDADKEWKRWDEKRQIIARAHEVEYFPPKPSGLCNGWCDVTTCKFWKPKRVK